MTDDGLDSLVEGLQKQINASSESSKPTTTSATALIVSCSMAQCRHEPLLWPIEPSWQTSAVKTLGSQTWESRNGQQVVDETLTHLTATQDVQAVVVIGHTACRVVADAYKRVVVPTEPQPGCKSRLNSLVSLVEEAIESNVVDESLSVRQACPRLVEYSIVRQVEFLTDQFPPTVTVVGYVYDQSGVYGSFPDKQYLVTVDGETTDLDSRVRDNEQISVGSLLS